MAADDTDILIVTDAGYGKRTKLERFNRQARGGQGVRGIRLTGKRGPGGGRLHGRRSTTRSCWSSSGGVVIRTAVREIASQGRDATGVRVMNLDEGQRWPRWPRWPAEEPSPRSPEVPVHRSASTGPDRQFGSARRVV